MNRNTGLMFPIESKILFIREKHVMIDRDLAMFYQTETRSIKQAVKRNRERFPEDFIFELNNLEIEQLVSQNVIPDKKLLLLSLLSLGRGGRG